ncbi:MAG: hypothetical protein IH969_06760, partial [Candidatus Krumholzibacteriota bacterium]|nr:hypothetical protein [Candidatus Krumholzibacteriota bacterium]
MKFEYEMPEMLKASLFVSMDDSSDNAAYVEDKSVKGDKTYGLWLHTPMLPFVQNVNLFYVANYMSTEGASDKNKVDNT